MVYYHLAIFVPAAIKARAAQGFGNGYSFGDDFYPIWLTSREGMLHHRDPDSQEATRQIQIGLFGRAVDLPNGSVPKDYRAFSYPAFVDVLFWPLGALPFSAARIALALILPVVTVFSIRLWLWVLHARVRPVTFTVLALLTVSSYAVLEGLFAEQMGLLVGFLLAASLAALVKGDLFFSGSLLALTLIKPQMMALLAVYLLLWSVYQWRDRWRLVAGFLFVSVLLVASSLSIWPRWIAEWLQVLSGYRRYSTPPLVSYVLGDQIGSRLGPLVIAVLLLVAILLAWRMRRVAAASTAFALTISLLLAITTITLLPGHAVYDHVVLLPGIILIAFSWRIFAASSLPFRALLSATAFAVFWQWICAPVVILLWLILTARLSSGAVTLPIRTAASIPFGVLALLGLMLWRSGQHEFGSGKR
jgi:hypothetical protein